MSDNQRNTINFSKIVADIPNDMRERLLIEAVGNNPAFGHVRNVFIKLTDIETGDQYTEKVNLASMRKDCVQLSNVLCGVFDERQRSTSQAVVFLALLVAFLINQIASSEECKADNVMLRDEETCFAEAGYYGIFAGALKTLLEPMDENSPLDPVKLSIKMSKELE